MNIEFATCERATALRWIVEGEPRVKADDKRLIPLLDLIRADIIRVRDPMMYKAVAIVQGREYSEDRQPDIDKAIKIFMEAAEENNKD